MCVREREREREREKERERVELEVEEEEKRFRLLGGEVKIEARGGGEGRKKRWRRKEEMMDLAQT